MHSSSYVILITVICKVQTDQQSDGEVAISNQINETSAKPTEDISLSGQLTKVSHDIQVTETLNQTHKPKHKTIYQQKSKFKPVPSRTGNNESEQSEESSPGIPRARYYAFPTVKPRNKKHFVNFRPLTGKHPDVQLRHNRFNKKLTFLPTGKYHSPGSSSDEDNNRKKVRNTAKAREKSLALYFNSTAKVKYSTTRHIPINFPAGSSSETESKKGHPKINQQQHLDENEIKQFHSESKYNDENKLIKQHKNKKNNKRPKNGKETKFGKHKNRTKFDKSLHKNKKSHKKPKYLQLKMENKTIIGEDSELPIGDDGFGTQYGDIVSGLQSSDDESGFNSAGTASDGQMPVKVQTTNKPFTRCSTAVPIPKLDPGYVPTSDETVSHNGDEYDDEDNALDDANYKNYLPPDRVSKPRHYIDDA